MAILQRSVSNVSTNNPQPIVGSVLVQSQKKNDKFYSSELLNYVESIEIDGVLKTVFFTKVNTNVNVGDRVFIVNGNYDSSVISESNKYARFGDGYRVLSVNGCRIVLDIEFTGNKPYDDYTTQNFVFVHHVENQKDFDYINSLKVSYGPQSIVKSTFYGSIVGNYLLLEGQNILYVEQPFLKSIDPVTKNGGVPGPGFWVRTDDGIFNDWIDVTSFVITNNIIARFSPMKLFIVGKKFKNNIFTFESGGIYKFEDYSWKIDITNYRPFISKLNFRGGKFSGIHNDGIFGSFTKKLFWKDSTWNSGVLLNTDWLNGFMNSKHTVEELSFSGKIQDVSGVSTVIQTEDNTNNRGFGYNFIENSTFYTYSIGNGNFLNCFFATSSQYRNSLDLYYGIGKTFENVVNGGKYEKCDMYDLRANGAYFLNSSISNANIQTSKLVSSEVSNSSAFKSYWSSDGGIKIVKADLWSFDTVNGVVNSPTSNLLGTLKLFISEEDYFKLSRGDVFHIQNINKSVIGDVITDDEKILTSIETKFIIDNFNDWDFVTNQKNLIRVSLSSSLENEYKYQNAINFNSFIPTYGYTFLENDPSYWYKLPLSKFKGGYSLDYDNVVHYEFNDIVYKDLDFYQYIPYDRGVKPLVRRAMNDLEFTQFVTGNWGAGLTSIDGLSDWVFIGTYSGTWSIAGTYSGEYVPAIYSPYFVPSFASGSIVSDGVDILNSNNFWIFVGQYNLPDANSSYNSIGVGLGNIGIFIEKDSNGQNTNAYTYNIISKIYNNQNLHNPSLVSLPSIDITSKSLGWYLDENFQFKPSIFNTTTSITPKNVSDLFTNTVIGNGDFKSGIMEESTWLSGDNMNYANNIIDKIGAGFLNIIVDTNPSTGKKILTIRLKDRKLSNYLDTSYDYFVGDYIWIKSIKSQYLGQRTQIDGKYKVVRYIPSQSELSIESADTVDKLQNLLPGTQFLLSVGDSNNYHSIHKFNLTKSKVVSGKFKRTGLDNIIFENDSFKKYAYPDDIKNNEIIRLVNVMLQDTNNVIKSGIVYKSHFVNDTFDGGTFYNSFFLGGTFSDGLFKSSVWTGGNFNGGRFVDSRESTVFSFDFDSTSNNKLWQGGNFNGGEFYNSLWVRGNFNGGRLYFSDWTGGNWNNGVLGSKDFRTQDTTMAYYGPTTSFGATHTVWSNGLVENALIGGNGSIDWYDGKMIGGEFTSFGRLGKTYSIWHNGEFYGSSFTRQAWWKDGNFYSGKFLSEIGWEKVNLLTFSNDTFDYGWVNGNFLGGEFGNGSTSTNSIWYDGVMENGVFQGRFWRNGLMTSGKFYGSLVTQSELSISLRTYTQSFYGLWNDGHVDSNVYNVKKDRIVATEDLQVVSSKNKPRPKIADLNRVVWKSGTFSHELSTFNDSVWLDGEFKAGNFNNSYFNPFVDLTLKGLNLSDYDKTRYLKQIYDNLNSYLQSNTNTAFLSFFLDEIKNLVNDYNNDVQISSNFVVEYSVTFGLYEPADADYENLSWDYTDYNDFDTTQTDTTVTVRISDPDILINNPLDFIGVNFYTSLSNSITSKLIYPNLPNWDNIPHSFNLSKSCVWNGGNFNSGEFNYSVWGGGNFNDGTINGAIWKNGVFNYGFMNNCFWEDGVWRNGNWNGTPFDYTNLSVNGNYWEITNKRVDQMLQNIASYSTNTNLHLSNVLVIDPTETTTEHSFQADSFYRWVVIEQQN